MIRDADHLVRLQSQIDLILADGESRTVFQLLEKLIGRANPAEKDHWSWADWYRYANFAKRNGYTVTDVVMALKSGAYPSGWTGDQLGVQVWTRRDHASV